MNSIDFKKNIAFSFVLFCILLIVNCSSDDSSNGGEDTSNIIITGAINPFGEVDVLSSSSAQSVQVRGDNLVSNVIVTATTNFLISANNVNFSNTLTISQNDANGANQTIYVKFSPSANAIGNVNGSLMFESNSATTKTINLYGVGLSTAPAIEVNIQNFNFVDTSVNNVSDSSSLLVTGDNLETSIDLTVTEGFEMSFDDVSYSSSLQISADNANGNTTLYLRFSPTAIGDASGVLNIENAEVENIEVTLSGEGLPVAFNYVTFSSERLAFGNGFNQSSTQTFNLHDDLTNIETIKMYVKLRCPTAGCDEWDVYANIKVKDPDSGEMYELGRYITPYWNDNSQLDRGFEFDVTDFKSLLTGSTELRIRTECWNSNGYEVSVDFDYIEGTPDFPYYAVSRVLAYDDWSSSGVPYGVDHGFDLDRTITIPANSESIHLRSIISGWGHASPNDLDGRPCAEWCYRTHDILIDDATAFQHNLEPLGCASNPVNNQNPGNWQPDRAGWCPGMVVPVRINNFGIAMAGSTFSFEYDYEDWVSDGLNGNAFYATSTFVIVKSNTPITKPVVID